MNHNPTLISDSINHFKSIFENLSVNDNTLRPITKDKLFELIDVQTPYFALQDVKFAENWVMATISPESPLGSEFKPISSAEACRHLAILGSVACAMANPVQSKHYYLAHQGTYQRYTRENLSNHEQNFRVIAECLTFTRRLATAKTYLLDDKNEVLSIVEAFYHVIPQTMFSRLFSHTYRDYIPVLTNPYTSKKTLLDLRFHHTGATASLGEVEENYCCGHFPNYPALPVAVLMGIIHDLCIAYIQYITENPDATVLIQECKLLADNLAAAGENVSLEVQLLDRAHDSFSLRGIATTKTGKIVGDVISVIDIV